MLQKFKQSLETLFQNDQGFVWLWPQLEAHAEENPQALEYGLSLLPKLEKLGLDTPYSLASLTIAVFGKRFTLESSQEEIQSVLTAHHDILRILSLKPSLKDEQQADLFLRMMISMVSDLRPLLSVLAIQLEVIERLGQSDAEDQKKISQISLSVYAKLAERLGIFWAKSEFEDIALRYIAPGTYYELKKCVAKKRHERSSLVETLIKELKIYMDTFAIPCEVTGRYKRFYSIYRKLKKVDYNFDRIQDLIAFRILTDSIQDCYKVLSYIHERWDPKPGRFKDYIANPKINGYQSLHTTVVTLDNEVIEIQIRTHEMHRVAEYGVAAHWAYKQGNETSVELQAFYNSLLKDSKPQPLPTSDQEAQKNTELTRLLLKKIYVFTPKNDIIEFPEGATSVDFAYAVHTQIGDKVVGAKANGKIVKLDRPMQSGDCMEVLTSPKQSPRKEWLSFVKTSRAKDKIRHAIHNQEREEYRKKGYESLEKELKKYQVNLNRLIREGELERMSLKEKRLSLEMLFFYLGEGSMKHSEVLRWFVEDFKAEPSVPKKTAKSKAAQEFSIERQERDKIKIISHINDIENIPVRFAKCCESNEHRPIGGYITQGSGISVHYLDCKTFEKMDSDRKINLKWSDL